ncbi:unnamed protein product [Hymenolepis diminuta]|uniref:Uncharacterized protein n=1 Tax=Hymenolepis diminuta TaxID=6216 RepID=A0A564Z4G2_HYMDI|nr:unnamed protein product [Hymenolepis diminuta]
MESPTQNTYRNPIREILGQIDPASQQKIPTTDQTSPLLPSPSSSKADVHERHPHQKPSQRIVSEKSPVHKPLIDALQPSMDKCLISENVNTDQFTQSIQNVGGRDTSNTNELSHICFQHNSKR